MPGKQHRYIGLGVIFCPLCVDSFCCTIVFYHIVKVVKRKLIVFSVVDTHPSKYGSDICGTSPSHMAKFSAAPSIPPKVSRITYLGNNYSYCLLLHSTHTLPYTIPIDLSILQNRHFKSWAVLHGNYTYNLYTAAMYWLFILFTSEIIMAFFWANILKYIIHSNQVYHVILQMFCLWAKIILLYIYHSIKQK